MSPISSLSLFSMFLVATLALASPADSIADLATLRQRDALSTIDDYADLDLLLEAREAAGASKAPSSPSPKKQYGCASIYGCGESRYKDPNRDLNGNYSPGAIGSARTDFSVPISVPIPMLKRRGAPSSSSSATGGKLRTEGDVISGIDAKGNSFYINTGTGTRWFQPAPKPKVTSRSVSSNGGCGSVHGCGGSSGYKDGSAPRGAPKTDRLSQSRYNILNGAGAGAVSGTGSLALPYNMPIPMLRRRGAPPSPSSPPTTPPKGASSVTSYAGPASNSNAADSRCLTIGCSLGLEKPPQNKPVDIMHDTRPKCSCASMMSPSILQQDCRPNPGC